MELNVLTMNIMMDGAAMDDPASELAQIMRDSAADIVIFSESSSAVLLKKIIDKMGNQWSGARAGSSAILSRFTLGLIDSDHKAVDLIESGDIVDQGKSGPAFNGADGITALVGVDAVNNGVFSHKSLIVSSIHAGYTNYAAYLPRGYDGNTWKPLTDGPVTDIQKIYDCNKASGRENQLKQVISLVEKYQGLFDTPDMASLIAGDFNEPSGIDWSEGLKSHFGHHGVVYDWDTTRLLSENGYTDTFHYARLKNCGLSQASPQDQIDACILKHPGITWQSRPPKDLQGHWAPLADDRDRVDFIFMRPCASNVSLIKKSSVVGDNYYYGYYQGQTSGPSTLGENETANGTLDDFLSLGYPTSDGRNFPSDHRGVMTTLEIGL